MRKNHRQFTVVGQIFITVLPGNLSPRRTPKLTPSPRFCGSLNSAVYCIKKGPFQQFGISGTGWLHLNPLSCPTLFTCYQQARLLMCVDLAKAQGGVEQQTGGGLRWLAVVARWTKHRLPLPANTGRPPLAYTVLSCLRLYHHQCTRCTGFILYWTFILAA